MDPCTPICSSRYDAPFKLCGRIAAVLGILQSLIWIICAILILYWTPGSILYRKVGSENKTSRKYGDGVAGSGGREYLLHIDSQNVSTANQFKTATKIIQTTENDASKRNSVPLNTAYSTVSQFEPKVADGVTEIYHDNAILKFMDANADNGTNLELPSHTTYQDVSTEKTYKSRYQTVPKISTSNYDQIKGYIIGKPRMKVKFRPEPASIDIFNKNASFQNTPITTTKSKLNFNGRKKGTLKEYQTMPTSKTKNSNDNIFSVYNQTENNSTRAYYYELTRLSEDYPITTQFEYDYKSSVSKYSAEPIFDFSHKLDNWTGKEIIKPYYNDLYRTYKFLPTTRHFAVGNKNSNINPVRFRTHKKGFKQKPVTNKKGLSREHPNIKNFGIGKPHKYGDGDGVSSVNIRTHEKGYRKKTSSTEKGLIDKLPKIKPGYYDNYRTFKFLQTTSHSEFVKYSAGDGAFPFNIRKYEKGFRKKTSTTEKDFLYELPNIKPGYYGIYRTFKFLQTTPHSKLVNPNSDLKHIDKQSLFTLPHVLTRENVTFRNKYDDRGVFPVSFRTHEKGFQQKPIASGTDLYQDYTNIKPYFQDFYRTVKYLSTSPHSNSVSPKYTFKFDKLDSIKQMNKPLFKFGKEVKIANYRWPYHSKASVVTLSNNSDMFPVHVRTDKIDFRTKAVSNKNGIFGEYTDKKFNNFENNHTFNGLPLTPLEIYGTKSSYINFDGDNETLSSYKTSRMYQNTTEQSHLSKNTSSDATVVSPVGLPYFEGNFYRNKRLDLYGIGLTEQKGKIVIRNQSKTLSPIDASYENDNVEVLIADINDTLKNKLRKKRMGTTLSIWEKVKSLAGRKHEVDRTTEKIYKNWVFDFMDKLPILIPNFTTSNSATEEISITASPLNPDESTISPFIERESIIQNLLPTIGVKKSLNTSTIRPEKSIIYTSTGMKSTIVNALETISDGILLSSSANRPEELNYKEKSIIYPSIGTESFIVNAHETISDEKLLSSSTNRPEELNYPQKSIIYPSIETESFIVNALVTISDKKSSTLRNSEEFNYSDRRNFNSLTGKSNFTSNELQTINSQMPITATTSKEIEHSAKITNQSLLETKSVIVNPLQSIANKLDTQVREEIKTHNISRSPVSENDDYIYYPQVRSNKESQGDTSKPNYTSPLKKHFIEHYLHVDKKPYLPYLLTYYLPLMVFWLFASIFLIVMIQINRLPDPCTRFTLFSYFLWSLITFAVCIFDLVMTIYVLEDGFTLIIQEAPRNKTTKHRENRYTGNYHNSIANEENKSSSYLSEVSKFDIENKLRHFINEDIEKKHSRTSEKNSTENNKSKALSVILIGVVSLFTIRFVIFWLINFIVATILIAAIIAWKSEWYCSPECKIIKSPPTEPCPPYRPIYPCVGIEPNIKYNCANYPPCVPERPCFQPVPFCNKDYCNDSGQICEGETFIPTAPRLSEINYNQNVPCIYCGNIIFDCTESQDQVCCDCRNKRRYLKTCTQCGKYMEDSLETSWCNDCRERLNCGETCIENIHGPIHEPCHGCKVDKLPCSHINSYCDSCQRYDLDKNVCDRNYNHFRTRSGGEKSPKINKSNKKLSTTSKNSDRTKMLGLSVVKYRGTNDRKEKGYNRIALEPTSRFLTYAPTAPNRTFKILRRIFNKDESM